MRHRQRDLDCMDALIRAIFFALSKRKVSAVCASRLTAAITFVTTAEIHLPLDRNHVAVVAFSFRAFPLPHNRAKSACVAAQLPKRPLLLRRKSFAARDGKSSTRAP